MADLKATEHNAKTFRVDMPGDCSVWLTSDDDSEVGTLHVLDRVECHAILINGDGLLRAIQTVIDAKLGKQKEPTPSTPVPITSARSIRIVAALKEGDYAKVAELMGGVPYLPAELRNLANAIESAK